uniref:Uncharacterized protein YuzE n=1 Tax=Candidatus Kentrum sp. UNK TaxID=2126344 RepID=A0A451ANG3_9GAMM|nr:MAG: Uncharacterized protein YuzE [Candidatus Kentron sp. UNK]VFK72746.1 MAG: Uncharacterized protein YuzE [Candidatus Kentron sp. UNK]
MKVQYDREVDALYLQIGGEKPNGVIEVAEGINIDTTEEGKLMGIEILNASCRIDLGTILSYSIELDSDMPGDELFSQVNRVGTETAMSALQG